MAKGSAMNTSPTSKSQKLTSQFLPVVGMKEVPVGNTSRSTRLILPI